MIPDFFLLTQTLLQRLTRIELEQWAIVSWAIWNARNKYCFVDTQAHPKAFYVVRYLFCLKANLLWPTNGRFSVSMAAFLPFLCCIFLLLAVVSLSCPDAQAGM